MSRLGSATATIEGVDDWAGSIDTVVCDLDGVIWLAHEPIEGAVEAIAAMRESGRRVLFATNNSAATLAEHEAALAHIGIPASGDVVSSAMAVTQLIRPGERVLVAAGPGVVESVAQAGGDVVVNDGRPTNGEFDVVVVGLHRDFDYDRLAVASGAARACGRLIGTNSDSTYPTAHGLQPGGGSILAAIASASGVDPIISGKPHEPMAALVASMLARPGEPFAPARVLMVGDRPETDGLFAARLGSRFALVRTGVSAPGITITASMSVDLDVADLAAVARRLVESRVAGE